MADLYEYSTPELVRLLGVRFKEYRMRCDSHPERGCRAYGAWLDHHPQV